LELWLVLVVLIAELPNLEDSPLEGFDYLLIGVVHLVEIE
jgi:hypothetical protein